MCLKAGGAAEERDDDEADSTRVKKLLELVMFMNLLTPSVLLTATEAPAPTPPPATAAAVAAADV